MRATVLPSNEVGDVWVFKMRKPLAHGVILMVSVLLGGCLGGIDTSFQSSVPAVAQEKKRHSALAVARALTRVLGPNGIEVRHIGPSHQVLVVMNGVQGFPLGQTTLTPVMQASLDKIARVLNQVEYSQVLITGHTDDIGSQSYNAELSRDRARMMLDYLSQRGLPRSHMLAIGNGKLFPVADNATEAGRAANRRMEISIQLVPR